MTDRPTSYRFGRFDFAPGRYALRCAGEPVAAEPKVLEVLGHLLAHRDRVVPKEELLEQVWHGAFVSDAALSRAVAELRRALASGPEGAAAKKWIETVYGRGFAYRGPEVTETAGDVVAGDSADAHSATPSASPSGLPVPLTPLLGREAELEAVVERLASARLLTLTGPGGTGKTRLALEAARRAEPAFADGAVFVPLSEIVSADGLAVALALALGVRDPAGSPLEAVKRFLAPRQVLLVLDNFEQMVQAAGVVAEVLLASPRSVALVTSRFVLQVEGEQEWPVPPLGLAQPDASDQQRASAPAVALFLARTRAVLPGYEPSGEDLAYVAEICRRLDGLPLAIELAAARVKLFAPGDLWQRLAERFDLLSSPARDRHRRHRTLDEAIRWSHDLLSDEERVLFRRLSVFAGGFTLPAAESVCGPPTPPLADAALTLGELVDRSLVVRTAEPRFHLLETTRAFARERLCEAGEETEVRRAHCRWLRDLAQRAESQLMGAGQSEWLRRLDLEHDNVLAALAFAGEDRAGPALAHGLEAAAALGRYWTVRNYSEGRAALERLLAAATEATPAVLRARAHGALGMLLHLLSEYADSKASLGEALAIARQTGDDSSVAQILNHLGWIAAQCIDLEQAEALSREALDLHRKACDPRGVAVSHNNLGWVRFFRGRLKQAEEHFSHSIEQRRAADDSRGLAFMLVNLAMARVHRFRAIENGLIEETEPVELADTEAWLDQAESLLAGFDDLPLTAWMRTTRSIVWLHRDRVDDSVATMRRELESTLEFQNQDGLTWVQLFLGEAEHRSGQPELARSTLEAARMAAAELPAPWIEMEAVRKLADLAADQGRADDARDLYCEAIAMAQSRGVSLTAEACRRALEHLNVEGDVEHTDAV